MRKLTFLFILVLSIQSISGQDLQAKIPANANIVAGINTGKMLQLMPLEEWNSSSLGRKIREMSAKSPGDTLQSISDAGISLGGTTYYFHTENDSMQYNCILVSLADAAKFENLFKDRPFTRLDNNTRLMTDPDSSSYMMWNSQQVLYVKGSLKDGYFDDPYVARRHGLRSHYYTDTTNYADTTASVQSPMKEQAPITDTSIVVDIAEPAIEPPVVKPEKKSAVAGKSKAKIKKNVKTTNKKTKKPAPPVEQEKEIAVEPPVETFTDTTGNDSSWMQFNSYDENYYIRKRITSACTQSMIAELFNHDPSTAITANSAYMKSQDANAVASIWIDQPMDLYYNLIPSQFMYGKGLGNRFLDRSNQGWYKNFSAKLFLEEKQLRLNSAVELTDEMVTLQQQLLNRKLNKKFLDYVNTDSVLGYMTWAMDTKAYLENFPKLLENAYGRMGLNGDEYSLIAEFLSFIIDEEAISRWIKGDGMVIFNGLYQQQTTYTDYVYDENYKSTAVEKTKTDTLPRFLLMFSSDENNFERKLINYGIRKETVKQRDGYYELAIPSSPVSLFFTNKDGIFFLTNSLADMVSVSQGTYKANISKQEKKYLLAHNYSLFINPSRISGQIATTEIGAAESLSSAMNTFSKMGNIRAVMNPIQANTMSGEMTFDVPANNRNALKYIFNLFDSFLK